MWSKEQIKDLWKYKADGVTYNNIADALNEKYHTHYTEAAVKHKVMRTREVKPEIDKTQSTTTILEMHEGDDKTPEDVLIAHGYDPTQWEIVHAKSNFWKQTPAATLYQSKIDIAPILPGDLKVSEVFEALTHNIKPVKLVDHTVERGNNLVVPLADLHFGWTKFEDVSHILNQIITIMANGYDNIVIEQLGDLYHSDFIDRTQTVRGTQLDHADMVQAIEDSKLFFITLLKTAYENANHVFVKFVGGNHSFDLEYMFQEIVKAMFPQIDVQVTDEKFSAYAIGNVAIMYGHGDHAKGKFASLFAANFPQLWGNAKWREVHSGHFHTKAVQDDNGVVLRQMGTPKPTDNYERDNGYSMSNKGVTLYEYTPNRLCKTYELGND